MTRTFINNNYSKLFIMSKGFAPGPTPDVTNYDDAYHDVPVNPLIVCNGGKLNLTNVQVTQAYAQGSSTTLAVDGHSAKDYFYVGDRVWASGTPMSLIGIVASVTDVQITLTATNATELGNNDYLYGERNYVACYEIRKNKQDPVNSESHSAKLMAAISATNQQTITVSNVDTFTSTGVVKINNEIIRYTSITGNNLELSTTSYRGFLSTTAATHSVGDIVYQLGNPYGNSALNMKGVSNSNAYPLLNRVYPSDNNAKTTFENIGFTKGHKIKSYSGITPFDSGLNASSNYALAASKEIAVSADPTLIFDIGDTIFLTGNVPIGEVAALTTSPNKIFLTTNNHVAISSGNDIFVGGKGALLPSTLIDDYDHFVLLYSNDAKKHHFAKITSITNDDILGDSFEFSPAYGSELSKGVTYSIYKGPKVEKELTLTSISSANPAIFTTSVAHNYSVGDEVNITDCNSTPYNSQNLINGKHFITDVTSTTQFKISNALNANLRTGGTGNTGKITLISPVVAVGYGLYGERTSINPSDGVDHVSKVFFNEYGSDSDASDGTGFAKDSRHIGMTYLNTPLFYFYNDKLKNNNQLDYNSKYKLNYSRSNGLQETHYQRCFLTQKGQGTIVTDYSKYGMEASVHDILKIKDNINKSAQSIEHYNETKNTAYSVDMSDWQECFVNINRSNKDLTRGSETLNHSFTGPTRYLHFDDSPSQTNSIPELNAVEVMESSDGLSSYAELNLIDTKKIYGSKIRRFDPYTLNKVLDSGKIIRDYKIKLPGMATGSLGGGQIVVDYLEYNMDLRAILKHGDEYEVIKIGDYYYMPTSITAPSSGTGTGFYYAQGITLGAYRKYDSPNWSNPSSNILQEELTGNPIFRKSWGPITNTLLVPTLEIDTYANFTNIGEINQTVQLKYGNTPLTVLTESRLNKMKLRLMDGGSNGYEFDIEYGDGRLRFIKLKSQRPQMYNAEYQLDANILDYYDGKYTIHKTPIKGTIEDIEDYLEQGFLKYKISGRNKSSDLIGPIVNRDYKFSDDIVYSTIGPAVDIENTNMQINHGAGYNVGQTAAMTIDGSNSTIALGDNIFTEQGELIGEVTAFGGTQVTVASGILITLADDAKIYRAVTDKNNISFAKSMAANPFKATVSSLSGSADKGIVFSGGNSLIKSNGIPTTEGATLLGTSSNSNKDSLGYSLNLPDSIHLDLPFYAKLADETSGTIYKELHTPSSLSNYTIVGLEKNEGVTSLQLIPNSPIIMGRVDENPEDIRLLKEDLISTNLSAQKDANGHAGYELAFDSDVYSQLGDDGKLTNIGDHLYNAEGEYVGKVVFKYKVSDTSFYICLDKIRTISPGVAYNSFALYRSNKQYQHLYLANTQGLDEGGNLQLVNSTLDNSGKPTQYSFNILDNMSDSTIDSNFISRYKSENYRFFNLQKGNSNSLGYKELDISNSISANVTKLKYKDFYAEKLGQINNYALAYKYNPGIKNTKIIVNKFDTVSVNSYTNPPIPNLGLVPAGGSAFYDYWNSDTTKWDLLAKTLVDGDCGQLTASGTSLSLMVDNPIQKVKDTFYQVDPKATSLFMFSVSDLYPESKRRGNNLMNQVRSLTDYSLLIKNKAGERTSNVRHTNYGGILPEDDSSDSTYELATIDTSSHTSDEIKRFGLLRLVEMTYDWRFNSVDFENPPSKNREINNTEYYLKFLPIVTTGDTVTAISGSTITCSATANNCIVNDRVYTNKGHYIGLITAVSQGGSSNQYTLQYAAKYNPIDGEYYTGPLYRSQYTKKHSSANQNGNPWSTTSHYTGLLLSNTFNFMKFKIRGNSQLSQNIPFDKSGGGSYIKNVNLLKGSITGGGSVHGTIGVVYEAMATNDQTGDSNDEDSSVNVVLPAHFNVPTQGLSALTNWATISDYWNRSSSAATAKVDGFIHLDLLMSYLGRKDTIHQDKFAGFSATVGGEGAQIWNNFQALVIRSYGISQTSSVGKALPGMCGLLNAQLYRITNGGTNSTTPRTNFPDSISLYFEGTNRYCDKDISDESLLGIDDIRGSGAQMLFKPHLILKEGTLTHANDEVGGTTTTLANISHIGYNAPRGVFVNHPSGGSSTYSGTDTIAIDDGAGNAIITDIWAVGDKIFRNNSGTTHDYVGIIESVTSTQIVFEANVAVTLTNDDKLAVSTFTYSNVNLGLNSSAQHRMISIRTTNIRNGFSDNYDNNWIRFAPNLTGNYLVSKAGKIHDESEEDGTELVNPDFLWVSCHNVVPDKIHKIISHTCRNKGDVQYHDLIIDNVNTNGDFKQWYKLFRPAHIAINKGCPNEIKINTMSSEYTKIPIEKDTTFIDGVASYSYHSKDKDDFANVGRASDSSGTIIPASRKMDYNEAALSMYLVVDSDASNYTASVDYSFLEHRKHDTYFKNDSTFKLGNTYEVGITDGKSKQKLSMTPLSKLNGTYLKFDGNLATMNGLASIGEIITLTTGSPISTDNPISARLGSTVTIGSEAEDIIQDILTTNKITYTKFEKDYPYYVAPNIQGADINNSIKFLAGFKNKDVIIDVDEIKLQSKSSGLRKTNIELSTTSDLIHVISVKNKKSSFGFYNHITVYGNGVKSVKQDSRSIKKVGKKSLERYNEHLLTKAEVEDRARVLLTQHNLSNQHIEVEVFDKNIGLIKPGDIIMVNMPDEQIDIDNYMVFEMLHGNGGTVTLQLGRYRQGLESTLAEMMTQNKQTQSKFRGSKFKSPTTVQSFTDSLRIKPLRLIVNKTTTLGGGNFVGFNTDLGFSTSMGMASSTSTNILNMDLTGD